MKIQSLSLAQYYRNKGYGQAFTKEDKLKLQVKADIEKNPLLVRPTTADEFEYHGSGVSIKGYFLNAVCHSAAFIALKGSKGRVHVPKASAAHMLIRNWSYKIVRDELIAAGILVEEEGSYVLTRDYCFSSSSEALAVMLGSTTGSGHFLCKRTGQTFHEVQY